MKKMVNSKLATFLVATSSVAFVALGVLVCASAGILDSIYLSRMISADASRWSTAMPIAVFVGVSLLSALMLGCRRAALLSPRAVVVLLVALHMFGCVLFGIIAVFQAKVQRTASDWSIPLARGVSRKQISDAIIDLAVKPVETHEAIIVFPDHNKRIVHVTQRLQAYLPQPDSGTPPSPP